MVADSAVAVSVVDALATPMVDAAAELHLAVAVVAVALQLLT